MKGVVVGTHSQPKCYMTKKLHLIMKSLLAPAQTNVTIKMDVLVLDMITKEPKITSVKYLMAERDLLEYLKRAVAGRIASKVK